MGKIGKSTRERLGLISDLPKEASVESKEPSSDTRITAFGIESSKDDDGRIQYRCVKLGLEGDKVVSSESLSPSHRYNKSLALEDWKLSTGKFILRRDQW